jgi:hypothetical protein
MIPLKIGSGYDIKISLITKCLRESSEAFLNKISEFISPNSYMFEASVVLKVLYKCVIDTIELQVRKTKGRTRETASLQWSCRIYTSPMFVNCLNASSKDLLH